MCRNSSVLNYRRGFLAFLASILFAAGVILVGALQAHAQEYNLWVDGGQVTDEHRSGEGWHYSGNGQMGTLTLDNAHLWHEYNGAAIYSEDLELTIEGTATLDTDRYAILSDGSMSVLTISGLETDISSTGVINSQGALIVESGTVSINSAADPDYTALVAGNALFIRGGSVSSTINSESAAAIKAPGISISGGTVMANNSSGDGIVGNVSIGISGGNVTANARRYGIFSRSIAITGTSTTVSSTVTGNECGAICGMTRFTIDNDKLRIATPSGGTVGTFGGQGYYWVLDGSTPAKSALIDPKPPKYSIKVNNGSAIDLENHTITSATAGTTVKAIYNDAPQGYYFKDWTFVKGISSFDVGERTFTMPAEAVELTANYAPHTFTVATPASGSFTYNGSKQAANPVVKDGDDVLKAGRDYAVSYEKDGAAVSDPIEVGAYKVYVTGTGDYCTMSKTAAGEFMISAAPAPDPTPDPQPEPAATVTMFRLYNPNSGEHFYTADAEERDGLVGAGWSDEGTGWIAPASSGTPVYRMYNPYAGEHHYTMDVNERDGLTGAGWNYEGVGWHSDDAQAVPLYRDYNPNQFANNHNYTTDASEHEWLVSLGWRAEGYAWYAVAAAG